MSVSTLVRSTATLLMVALAAACSDGAVAPTAARSMNADRLTAPTLRRDGVSVPVVDMGNGKMKFTIDPSKAQNVILGNHTLAFPAYSICDPATSNYGEAYWDAPCRAAREPLTFTAEWTEQSNHAYIEFEPSVRFVPSPSWATDRWVVLSLKESHALQLDDDAYKILWRGSHGAWIDESLRDATLRAWVDRGGNRVSRRIKHFSGYNVTAGFRGEDVEVSVRSY
jgi:hypothetical protein